MSPTYGECSLMKICNSRTFISSLEQGSTFMDAGVQVSINIITLFNEHHAG